MDIAEVFSQAKRILLEDGEHRPMLIVECKSQNYLLPILQMGGSTFEKEKMLFAMGRTLAKTQSENAETVQAICMITEAWSSRQAADRPLRPIRPSEDPNRIEIIMVIMLTTANKTIHQDAYMAEMLRDGSGKLQDLLPYGRMDGVKSMLLPAFLAGVASTIWSDKEFKQAMRRFGDVGEF